MRGPAWLQGGYHTSQVRVPSSGNGPTEAQSACGRERFSMKDKGKICTRWNQGRNVDTPFKQCCMYLRRNSYLLRRFIACVHSVYVKPRGTDVGETNTDERALIYKDSLFLSHKLLEGMFRDPLIYGIVSRIFRKKCMYTKLPFPSFSFSTPGPSRYQSVHLTSNLPFRSASLWEHKLQ